MSIIITSSSGPRGQSADLTENGNLELFDSLVRDYCGVGFFECLGCPESEYLTSPIWEESGSRPPALFRTVIELLHRAIERESE